MNTCFRPSEVGALLHPSRGAPMDHEPHPLMIQASAGFVSDEYPILGRRNRSRIPG